MFQKVCFTVLFLCVFGELLSVKAKQKSKKVIIVLPVPVYMPQEQLAAQSQQRFHFMSDPALNSVQSKSYTPTLSQSLSQLSQTLNPPLTPSLARSILLSQQSRQARKMQPQLTQLPRLSPQQTAQLSHTLASRLIPQLHGYSHQAPSMMVPIYHKTSTPRYRYSSQISHQMNQIPNLPLEMYLPSQKSLRRVPVFAVAKPGNSELPENDPEDIDTEALASFLKSKSLFNDKDWVVEVPKSGVTKTIRIANSERDMKS